VTNVFLCQAVIMAPAEMPLNVIVWRDGRVPIVTLVSKYHSNFIIKAFFAKLITVLSVFYIYKL